MAPVKRSLTLPPPASAWFDPKTGVPTREFARSMDALFSVLGRPNSNRLYDLENGAVNDTPLAKTSADLDADGRIQSANKVPNRLENLHGGLDANGRITNTAKVPDRLEDVYPNIGATGGGAAGQVGRGGIQDRATFDFDVSVYNHSGATYSGTDWGTDEPAGSSVSIDADSNAANQVVIVDYVVVLERDGGTNQNRAFRLERTGGTSDPTIIDHGYDVEQTSARMSHTFRFVDDSPEAGATHAYQVQSKDSSGDGDPAWYVSVMTGQIEIK